MISDNVFPGASHTTWVREAVGWRASYDATEFLSASDVLITSTPLTSTGRSCALIGSLRLGATVRPHSTFDDYSTHKLDEERRPSR